MSTTAARPTRSTRSPGWAPFALLAVVLVPAVAGSLRLVELGGGPHLMPPDARLTGSPIPLAVHIVSALLLAGFGAFQLSASFRRRRPRWHRVAGRVLVVVGLAVAASALWLTLLLPRQPGTGELAFLLRLAFGTGLVVALVLGVAAIRRGDVPRHRGWMTRAYALALGAGTQVVTEGVGLAVFGPQVPTRDVALGVAWVLNLAIAEVVIRRGARVPVARAGG